MILHYINIYSLLKKINLKKTFSNKLLKSSTSGLYGKYLSLFNILTFYLNVN